MRRSGQTPSAHALLSKGQAAPQAGIGIDVQRTGPCHLGNVLRAGTGIGNVGNCKVEVHRVAHCGVYTGILALEKLLQGITAS